MEELVFAIPTNDLWELIPYEEQGLTKVNGGVLDIIIGNGLFRNRGELEEDPSFKQIIPYAIISNEDSYFLFKRTSAQTENRLHNKFSLGVGGHMNPGKANDSKEQYLINELHRELFEEVKLSKDCLIEEIKFVGFINDDTIAVGRFHIGLLFDIRVSNQDVVVNEPDKMTADWIDKAELHEFYEGMETWSRIIFDSYIK